MEKTLKSLANRESPLICYRSTCQYEDVAIATPKEIATDVCYLGMLCKWKTAWFGVIQVQFEVFIDG